MIHNQLVGIILAVIFLVGGTLTAVFSKRLAVLFGRPRKVFGPVGVDFANRVKPWNYVLAGVFIAALGVVLLLLVLFA